MLSPARRRTRYIREVGAVGSHRHVVDRRRAGRAVRQIRLSERDQRRVAIAASKPAQLCVATWHPRVERRVDRAPWIGRRSSQPPGGARAVAPSRGRGSPRRKSGGGARRSSLAAARAGAGVCPVGRKLRRRASARSPLRCTRRRHPACPSGSDRSRDSDRIAVTLPGHHVSRGIGLGHGDDSAPRHRCIDELDVGASRGNLQRRLQHLRNRVAEHQGQAPVTGPNSRETTIDQRRRSAGDQALRRPRRIQTPRSPTAPHIRCRRR
jgi:hypothetical protein